MGEIEKEKDMRLIDADLLEKEFIKDTPQGCGTVGIKYIDDLIKKQPTIEVPQWIPCSERLPNNSGYYLVTQSMHSLKDFNKILRSDVECVEFCHGEWKRAKHLEVIAWMPLPSVWKGENNAEK